jgi:hypothetical protein
MSRNYIREEAAPGWWTPIVHFLGHTLAGTMIFLIIALPAVGLYFLVKYLAEVQGVSGYTIEVLKVLEHVVLTIDAALLVIYVMVTAMRAARELLQSMR